MKFIFLIVTAILLISCSQAQDKLNNMENKADKYKVVKTEEEWRKILTPVQFNILREKGTEQACTGKFDDFYKEGKYVCAGCGNVLFDSKTKYKSGTGWPSFFDTESDSNVVLKKDTSYGMIRTEVLCAKCDGHLGHVFKDGPKPNGLRYCINSAALKHISEIDSVKRE